MNLIVTNGEVNFHQLRACYVLFSASAIIIGQSRVVGDSLGTYGPKGLVLLKMRRVPRYEGLVLPVGLECLEPRAMASIMLFRFGLLFLTACFLHCLFFKVVRQSCRLLTLFLPRRAFRIVQRVEDGWALPDSYCIQTFTTWVSSK